MAIANEANSGGTHPAVLTKPVTMSGFDSVWHLLEPPRAKKRKSGVLQPTEFQVRIIFADAGRIPSRLEKCLIKDERVHLLTLDLLETAEVFDASIIIGSNFDRVTG